MALATTSNVYDPSHPPALPYIITTIKQHCTNSKHSTNDTNDRNCIIIVIMVTFAIIIATIVSAETGAVASVAIGSAGRTQATIRGAGVFDLVQCS